MLWLCGSFLIFSNEQRLAGGNTRHANGRARGEISEVDDLLNQFLLRILYRALFKPIVPPLAE